jgi:hypothetical protein
MSDAEGKISCSATPQLIKSQEVKAIMGESRGGFEVGVFHVVLTDKDGNVLYEDYARNGTTTEFAKEIWNTVRAGSTPVSLGQASRTLHIHCYTNSAAATGPTLLVADTYATSVGGTGASFDTGAFAPTTGTGWVAQTWAPTAPTGNSTVEITAAAVAFTGAAQSNAVVGAYVYSQASSGSAGVLVATANFSSGISGITASDTLNVTFTSGLVVS